MSQISINEIKYQAAAMASAMVRNINDNFINISFDIRRNGDVQVRIILTEYTSLEHKLIDDMMAELSADQVKNCVLTEKIVIGKTQSPLQFEVYKRVDIS